MEFSKNRKGNTVLAYMGFEYNKFRENKTTGEINWRCNQYKTFRCKAFIKTNGGKVLTTPSHSHDSCPQKAVANIVMSRMKEALNYEGATPKDIIRSQLSNLDSNVLAYLPKRSSITRSLLRHLEGGRHSNPNPNRNPNPNPPNFTIEEKYDHIILCDTGADDPERILTIGDKDILDNLDTTIIYGDGTFDKTPTIPYQLYTWYGKVGNSYPPCVYFLLRKKNQQTYANMLQILKTILPSQDPHKILVDFDRTCISAVRSAFPSADVKGCYFHLSQSVVRKLNTVGLKNAYELDVDMRLKLRSLAALAFVPVNDVKHVFGALAESIPDDPNFNEVLTYFFSTYVEGAIGRNPQFPIKMWNQYEVAAEKSPKMTYCPEKFHNKLNSLFHGIHPSIWLLFDGLERDISCHKLAYEKTKIRKPAAFNKKTDNLHAQIAIVVEGYEKEYDKMQYLKRIANMTYD